MNFQIWGFLSIEFEFIEVKIGKNGDHYMLWTWWS